MVLEVDEIECNLDEDFDNEHYTGKHVKDSFINKLRDFSSFNPSTVVGKDKINNSEMVIPKSTFEFKRQPRGTGATKDSFVIQGDGRHMH